MKLFVADMHIHSALSPCGSLEMSAFDIVMVAKRRGINIISLTDHNCTKQVEVIIEIGRREGILVIPGLEVNSSEEVHALVYFETIDQLKEFQLYLDDHLPKIPNNKDLFGDQVYTDIDGTIVGEVDELLLTGLTATFEQISRKVHALNGLVVPAHIDKPRNSIISQLGFIPKTASIDAVEIYNPTVYEDLARYHPDLQRWSVMSNSDAHFLRDIGRRQTLFKIEKPSFEEIKKAMHKEGGRWMGC